MARSLGQPTARLVANWRDHLKCSLLVDLASNEGESGLGSEGATVFVRSSKPPFSEREIYPIMECEVGIDGVEMDE